MSGLPSVGIEKSEISASINSTLLLLFLMGMYTVVYFETIYIYFTRGSSKSRLVPGAITILYLDNILQTAFQWYGIKWQFDNNGATRDSMFLAMYEVPQWVSLGATTTAYIGFVLADGLLIWRCFFVWNRSFRAIAAPLLLIIAEAGLFLVQVAVCALHTDPTISKATADTFNDLLSAAFFTSFATTLLTTILIAYRIHSVLKEVGSSEKRYKRILDIVIQSGALYSITMLGMAIDGVLSGSISTLNTIASAYGNDFQILAASFPGMSTTIMVARVALLSAEATPPATLFHVTDLQFQTRPIHQTNTVDETDAPHSADVQVGEAHKVEGKVQ